MPKRRVGADETAPGTTAGAGGAETEIVAVDYPPTGSTPPAAWSQAEPATELLPQSWSQAWSAAAVLVLIGVVTAMAVAGWALLRSGSGHHEPLTQPVSTMPAAALPPIAASTSTPPRDDEEYPAIAFSLTAPGKSAPLAAAGVAGTQDRADQVALNLCRARGGDICMTANEGMYHGCVGLAVDDRTLAWGAGVGPSSDAARADALARLGVRAAHVVAQCFNPPGVLPNPTPTAPWR
jgi:hypothetical protein